tara:strand:- start:13304 stop:16144 length:2841 start_codon:yes stop_codon:yes gene_type:complete
MDKCRYKTLLRDSAKLISNSQYTNKNTAYLPLDVYTCYDVFYRPTITMSGASKLSKYNKYSFSGSPYTTLNMLPTGPTGDTNNSVWNVTKSAATLEYYIPHSFATGYTGKFRSSVYKWDDRTKGFVYPPVHQRLFGAFPKTPNLACSATTTSSTYSVFFSISGVSESGEIPYLSKPSFYWWGKSPARTSSDSTTGSISSVGTISAADGSRTPGTYTLGAADYSTSSAGVNATFTVVVDSVGGANGGVLTTANVGAADPLRAAATYAIGASDYTTELAGNSATFSIVVDGTGAATVTITAPGKDFVLNETITVPDANLGSGGAAALTFEAATIAGITITNGGEDFVVTEVVNVPDANLGGGGAANLTFNAATVHGCCLLQHDDFSTGGTLSNYLTNVKISTGGTLQNFGATGDTFYFGGDKPPSTGILSYNAKFTTANKNGHILPIPNPTTGALNLLNEGVTGNAGYWEKDQCYMSGMTYDFAIGAGNGTLSGGPQFVSATTDYHGYYTGFATGNVYVYSACCQHKLVDQVLPSALASERGPGYAENSNDFLVKNSFVYSGDGTTASCYLTSGLTYDTLIDNPNDKGYEGLISTIYKNNLNYSGTDYTFIAVTDPGTPLILNPQNSKQPYDATSLGIATGMTDTGIGFNMTDKIELIVEDLPVVTSGQSEYYLSQEPVGDISLTLNGVALLKDIEYIKDQRKVSIIVDKTVSNSVNIKTSDRIVVAYIKGSTVDGFVSETDTVPTTVVSGNTAIDNNYNTFNYNTGSTSYEYYTNQQILNSNDLSNTIVLLNGVRLIPNEEYWKSSTNIRRIIFNENIRLVAGDIVNVFYITDLTGINSQSLSTPYKSITWGVTPVPKTSAGYFEIQVTNSADTKFDEATTWTTIIHQENKTQYNTKIGPFDTLNQRYLYRIVNYKTYVSVSGSTLTTTATSLTNKFDTFNASLKSY